MLGTSHQHSQYALTFIFSTLVAIYYSFYADTIHATFMLLLLVAVVILAFISASLLTIENDVTRFLRFVDTYDEDLNTVIGQLITRLHRPSVRRIWSSNELVKSIADEIRELTGRDDATPAITFVGALSLQTPDEGTGVSSVHIEEGEDRQTPHQIYQGSLEEATARKALIQRYVRLLPEEEVTRRSPAFVEDYLRWLSSQMSQISRNENNFLIDTPRAPKWGSLGARIIIGENIFDITRKNGLSLHLRDRRIAALQAQSLRLAALSAAPANITVYCKDTALAEAFFPGANVVDVKMMDDVIKDLRQRTQNA